MSEQAKPSPSETTDPTFNVIALVQESNRRIEDLIKAEVRRLDDLRLADMESTKMRINLEDQLRIAESKRIDANRQFDVNNVAIASQSQAEQARILATQMATSSEMLRGAIETTAKNQATALERVVTDFSGRISVVERVQYEGSGKQAVADPLNAAMLAEMKAMREQFLTGQGSNKGMKDLIGWIVAGIFLVIAVVGFFAAKVN